MVSFQFMRVVHTSTYQGTSYNESTWCGKWAYQRSRAPRTVSTNQKDERMLQNVELGSELYRFVSGLFVYPRSWYCTSNVPGTLWVYFEVFTIAWYAAYDVSYLPWVSGIVLVHTHVPLRHRCVQVRALLYNRVA